MSVESGSAPLQVEFAVDSPGPVTSWEWEFGDGQTSTDQSPIHNYTAAGDHTVRLSVTGPGGTDESVFPDMIHVLPGPAATLGVQPLTATLRVKGSTQFEAVVLDAFGNKTNDPVVWTVERSTASIDATGVFTVDPTAASIDSTGAFTAGTLAGVFPETVKASLESRPEALQGLATVVVEPGPLFDALLDPTKLVMDIKEHRSLAVKATDRYGNEVPGATLSWKSVGEVGKFDSAGVLVAGQEAGTFPDSIEVQVVAAGLPIKRTADLTIRPDPLAKITVEPSVVSLGTGTMQRFTAVGLDKYGNQIPDLDFLWESSGVDLKKVDAVVAEITVGGEGDVYEITAPASSRGSEQTGRALAGVGPVRIPSGTVSLPQRGHQAVLLENGNLLIVGDGGPLLYTPSTRATSVVAGSRCSAFWETLAVRMADGRVLLVTGRYGRQTLHSCAEIYDPVTNMLSPTDAPAENHSRGTATLLNDGRILLIGGYRLSQEGNLQRHDQAELFVPVAGTFEITGSLNVPRTKHSATLLPDGKVLVAGGHTNSDRPNVIWYVSDVEIYDPVTGTFDAAGETTSLHDSANTVLLDDGTVLVVGGIYNKGAELFDPLTKKFEPVGTASRCRRDFTATVLANGNVLLAGGEAWSKDVCGSSGDDPLRPTPLMELFDPETRTFGLTAELGNARVGHTATPLPGGAVLILGGIGTSGDLESAELYFPLVETVNVDVNLAPNTSFEEGDNSPAGWVSQQRGTDASFELDAGVAHGGKQSIKIMASRAGTAGFPGWQMEEAIPIDTDGVYEFSAYYYVTDVGLSPWIEIGLFDVSGTHMGGLSTGTSSLLPSPNQWFRAGLTLDPARFGDVFPREIAAAKLGLRLSLNYEFVGLTEGTVTTINYDDVIFGIRSSD